MPTSRPAPVATSVPSALHSSMYDEKSDSKAVVERVERVEGLPLPVMKRRPNRLRKERTRYTPKPGFKPANLHMPPLVQTEELEQHRFPDDAWICINDLVFDVTAFMAVHPGGRAIVESFAGKQCDWQFERFHGKPQLTVWAERLFVGRVESPPLNLFPEPGRWITTGDI
ncbi:cytochrome b5 [Athelia psychrophila]|uniref:Cytochrome b5 n=1 Tax=Athelia psychrophila TaxID=1759441 RepID=A0A166LBT5_9AGAM|nr:cytochrome b5 [Fibularhizoctonia sp. CBS 109695]